MELMKAPLFRMYKLTINADDRDKFVEEGEHNLLTSVRNEPGTLAMYATHEDEAGTTNYVFEIYLDEERYQVHANSPQFKSYSQLAQQVITDREVHQLHPAYLSISNGFEVAGINYSPVELYDLTIAKDKVKHLKHLLSEEGVASFEELRGFSTFNVASVDEDETHWIILTIFKDRANQNKSKSWLLDLLNDSTAKYQLHQLVVDTMVSQDKLEYSDLDD
ncbi:antibiotic biosynthesis monooxygenase family protein [Companilactobacillus sp.]|uniref:putative quinol monooxygenase n=1 Tax=Companilactobacillus sp. TaxID=2767905 RepID=UPI0026171649|nr:antibiotic biosynthesis monooxygenase family protein [Companilactobacillus sp.]